MESSDIHFLQILVQQLKQTSTRLQKQDYKTLMNLLVLIID